MNFRSTRSDECVSPSYALLHGLAADGGLYVPEAFSEDVLSYKELSGKSYQEIADVVLSHFFTNFTADERKAMIASAYNEETFRDDRIVPLHSIDTDLSVAELFHGRTLAFKALALSLFPYLLTAAKKQEQENRSNVTYAPAQSDAYLLAAIIQCEAWGEPYDGKLAVGSVIMNRVRSSYFPNTVSGVIYQGGQFSPVASGRLAYRLEQGVASDCMSAAQAVLGGTSTTNCLYFRVNNGIIEGTVIGNHVFY